MDKDRLFLLNRLMSMYGKILKRCATFSCGINLPSVIVLHGLCLSAYGMSYLAYLMYLMKKHGFDA